MSYHVQKVNGGYVLHGAGSAWTISDESYDSITEYLKQPKAPTPEERAKNLYHQEFFYHLGELDGWCINHPEKMIAAIAGAIRAAIEADREARQ